MLRDEALWAITGAYWCCAISAAAVKLLVPSVDGLLRYGLRRQYHHQPRDIGKTSDSQCQQSTAFLFRLLLDPSHGIPPRACWATFYAIAFANSCVLAIFYTRSVNHHSLAQYLFRHPVIAMFALHVLRRLLEVLFLQNLSPKPLMSVGLFAMGASFYIFAPYTIVRTSAALPPPTSSVSAVYLFLAAQTFQHLKHRALVNVRPPLVRRKYGIPPGFDVACPHYSAEIFTYLLFVVLAPSVPAALMLAFVVLNLAHSASQTLAWYRQTFRGHLKKDQFKYALLKYVF